MHTPKSDPTAMLSPETMRAIILDAGLPLEDCLDEGTLRARALEALHASGMLPAPSAPGATLKAMGPGEHVRSIVSSAKQGRSASEPAPALKPVLGPDFDDEEEVPPLL